MIISNSTKQLHNGYTIVENIEGKQLKNRFKLTFVCLLLMFLNGCNQSVETSEKPWMGFAKHKSSGKLQWWFSGYSSYEECIEAMNWGVTNTENKLWYEKPVGCGFSSNSYFKSIFINILIADMSHFECLVESKNPELRKIKAKFGPVLKGYNKDCINNSKQKVIF